MIYSGWGNYPKIDAVLEPMQSAQQVMAQIADPTQDSLIARGLGRSYGDSSLAPLMLSTLPMDHLVQFDENSGALTCSAGTSLADILSVFVPRGWFLPVTPGTKFITVGGAIASDVHGKNHHVNGCFSAYLDAMKIVTVSDGLVECSPSLRPELFHATCGGMGLTGIITEASFRLKPINSALIRQTTIKAENLDAVFDLFEAHNKSTYSVAWIDCLATGNALGRSLLMLGEHGDTGDLNTREPGKLTVPFNMPGFLLNSYSIKAFNSLYYHRILNTISEQLVHYEPFFYPLDGITHWNRLYGNNGFTQYQLVLPKAAGLEGMRNVLQHIAASRRGSFLAVLKAFGKHNANYLSFPLEGYTLALDFKLEKGLFELLDELDRMVLDHGGRLYLTKDVRMSAQMFTQSYPQWDKFMAVRQKYGADDKFNSLQSQRLGL